MVDFPKSGHIQLLTWKPSSWMHACRKQAMLENISHATWDTLQTEKRCGMHTLYNHCYPHQPWKSVVLWYFGVATHFFYNVTNNFVATCREKSHTHLSQILMVHTCECSLSPCYKFEINLRLFAVWLDAMKCYTIHKTFAF